MHAPADRIFALAADVERWPERLPHYRYVRRLPVARWVIGPQFVEAIARRTLRRVKELAEDGVRAREAEGVA